MACPKCHYRMRVQDRICPRCRFLPDLDAIVEIAPPRASRPTQSRIIAQRHLRALMVSPADCWERSMRITVFGLVPALGHLVARQHKRALAYAAAWYGITGVAFIARGVWGQVLLAMAALVHAHSLADLWPRSEFGNENHDRARYIAFSLILLFLVYWPVTELLGWVEPIQVASGANGIVWGHIFFYIWIVILGGLLFGVSYLFFVLVSYLLSKLMPKRGGE